MRIHWFVACQAGIADLDKCIGIDQTLNRLAYAAVRGWSILTDSLLL